MPPSIFAEEPPEKLYHYTSASSLHLILKHKSIWASSVQFMNDSSELTEAISLTRQLLMERADTTSSPQVANELRKLAHVLGPEILRRDPDFQEPVTVCAFSLSARHDSLSQWRAYCPVGGGFILAFWSGPLVEATRKGSPRFEWRLAKCAYDQASQLAVIGELVDWTERAAADPANLFESFWPQFLRYASLVKNRAFSEEEEWRLVSGKIPLRQLDTRASRLNLIPYTSIDLGHPYTWMAGITVGPHDSQELAHLGATGLILQLAIPELAIKSPIPYRVVY